MPPKTVKGTRQMELVARDLAEKLDDAVREEFFGYLLKLRSAAKRIELKEKVAEEAKIAASIVLDAITSDSEQEPRSNQ